FGFVTVSDETADKVIENLDGHDVQGRRLKVQKAKGGGGGGGGRKGGGDRKGGGGQRRGGDERSSREMQARKEEGLDG
ncbi:MAG: RNA-binding protein, partial [Candidatus Poseidoniaceae archaeon]|nr:RNA-binding protein [Candidatus Poseidoniaceae archaeon]